MEVKEIHLDLLNRAEVLLSGDSWKPEVWDAAREKWVEEYKEFVDSLSEGVVEEVEF
jgi:hypothetical protein